MTPTRPAISLMRRMLRISRDWRGEGGFDEAVFIITETRRVFREKSDLVAGSPECEAALNEGEQRLEIAKHYGIAYPRLAHSPLAGGGDVKNILPPAEMKSEQSTWASHVGETGMASGAVSLAQNTAPVNPAANAARAKARAKRAAAFDAAASATKEE